MSRVAKHPWFKYRDEAVTVVALLGLAGQAVSSIVFGQAPDPQLLYLFGALLGVPIFLNADRRGGDDQ